MSNYNNRAVTLEREPKQFATGKSGTNRIHTSQKLVSMQHSKEEIERKVVDVIDYRLLRKNGGLRK